MKRVQAAGLCFLLVAGPMWLHYGKARVFRLWAYKWCHNPSVEPTFLHMSKNIDECAAQCFTHGCRCRAFSFETIKGCLMFEYPLATTFKFCSDDTAALLSFIEVYPTITSCYIGYPENAALYKPTAMSSIHVWHEWNQRTKPHIPFGSLAVDGFEATGLHKPEDVTVLCSVTSPKLYSWWRVDLLEPFVVIQLIVSNNDVHIYSALRNIEMRVGYTDIARLQVKLRQVVFRDNDLCASSYDENLYQGEHYFQCTNPVEGRFVSVQTVGPCSLEDCPLGHYLVLCEVQVWAFPVDPQNARHNVAFLKPTEMPETFPRAHPFLATDGMIFPEWLFAEHNADVVRPMDTPYLQIMLWQKYLVDAVLVANALSYYDVRLHDFEIRIGGEKITRDYASMAYTGGELCYASYDTILDDLFVHRYCQKPLVGDKVTIQIVRNTTLRPHRELLNRLTLREFLVYGFLLESSSYEASIAFNKLSMQSSTERGNDANFAVDGYTATEDSPGVKCARTAGNEQLPWWRVDLKRIYYIEAVELFQKELLHDFDVRVGMEDISVVNPYEQFTGNALCVSIIDEDNAQIKKGRNHFRCTEIVRGQYISVQIIKSCTVRTSCEYSHVNVLNLCEVRALGYPEQYKDMGYEKIGNDFLWTYLANNQLNVMKATKTSQSSTWFRGVEASVANSDVWNLQFKMDNKYMCTHTNPQRNVDNYPYLQLDLGQQALVRKISIFNRGEDNEWRLRDIEIRVGNKNVGATPLNRVITDNSLCAEVKNDYVREGWARFYCPFETLGQFVSIQIVRQCNDTLVPMCSIDRGNVLSLCQVHVHGFYLGAQLTTYYRNAALKRPGLLSSTNMKTPVQARDAPFLTDNIVTCPIIYDRPLPCTMLTDPVDMFPWIEIDLQEGTTVTGITLISLDDKEFALHDLQVWVGNYDVRSTPFSSVLPTNNFLCSERLGVQSSKVVTLNCSSPATGRYVTVQIVRPPSSTSGVQVLALLEVSVWAVASLPFRLRKLARALNLALFKPTAQSTYESSGFNAVDGKKAYASSMARSLPDPTETCAVTETQMHPWWRADLGTKHVVNNLSINYMQTHGSTAEKGISNILEVRIGAMDIRNVEGDVQFAANQFCGTITLSGIVRQRTFTVTCPRPLRGRYVSIQRRVECEESKDCSTLRDSLILCEVEIFGAVDKESEDSTTDSLDISSMLM